MGRGQERGGVAGCKELGCGEGRTCEALGVTVNAGMEKQALIKTTREWNFIRRGELDVIRLGDEAVTGPFSPGKEEGIIRLYIDSYERKAKKKSYRSCEAFVDSACPYEVRLSHAYSLELTSRSMDEATTPSSCLWNLSTKRTTCMHATKAKEKRTTTITDVVITLTN